MFKRILASLTIVGLGLAAGSAEALDFSFSGVSSSPLTASGTFRINDSAIPSSNLSQSDFLDWEINIFNSITSTTTTLYGNGGSFGIDNSDIASFPVGLSVDNSTLDFSTITSGSLCITNDGTCTTNQGYLFANGSNVRLTDANNTGTLTPPALTANVVTATPVPFELSPTLGLLMVGGIWVINSLRQSRKS